MVILVIVGGLLMIMIDTTSKVTKRPVKEAAAFREARRAFERMTSQLSQATLSPYWAFDNPSQPTRYLRHSDLHFVSGQASDLLAGTGENALGHAVFFQAPLGSTEQDSLELLNNLLSESGFYLEFGSDVGELPSFISSVIDQRYRYRLIEFERPTEQLSVTRMSDTEWITTPLNTNPSEVKKVLAENFVLLVILPRLTRIDDPEGDDLAPQFAYDSRANATGTPQPATANQLPPLVDVIAVAIAEQSAARLQSQYGSSRPDFGQIGLFQSVLDLEDDLNTLESALQNEGVQYRIFRTTVNLQSAKWSNS